MIGRISGRLDWAGPDRALVDVGGVGYVVHLSEATRAALPAPGAPVTLYTELLVREDLMQLIGYLSPVEIEWHRLLTTVQGVGARAAMAILGVLGPDGLSRAIALGDWGQIRAAPGVGPKIAQRVVNELRERAPQMMAAATAPAPAVAPELAGGEAAAVPAPPSAAAAPSAPAASAEALSALGNLGYAPGEAARAVAEAAAESPGADTPALIRAALRRLAPAG